MGSIADSQAFRDDGRVLPQHQAALTLLQGLLADPSVESVRWLDLACGRGQILLGLEDNLSVGARKKIDYDGYDVRLDYTREVAQIASKLGLKSQTVKIGELVDFSKLYASDDIFDFITLTNTVHEVHPAQLASVLGESITRLTPCGCLFIYDIEKMHPLELGAVNWHKNDVEQITNSLCKAFGAADYEPSVGQWKHSSCDAWNVQIHMQHLGLSRDQLISRQVTAVRSTEDAINSCLTAKLDQCISALDSLTEYGAGTSEELSEKVRLLYEFWALSRALGRT